MKGWICGWVLFGAIACGGASHRISPLAEAIDRNDRAAFERELATASQADKDGAFWFVFNADSAEDRLAMIRLLLDHGADPNAVIDGDYVLDRAVLGGTAEMVSLFLERGAKIPTPADREDSRERGTLLTLAIQSLPAEERVAKVEIVLDAGLDVNERYEAGSMTPLEWAMGPGRDAAPDPEVVRLLLARGANPKDRNPITGVSAADLLNPCTEPGQLVGRQLLEAGVVGVKPCPGVAGGQRFEPPDPAILAEMSVYWMRDVAYRYLDGEGWTIDADECQEMTTDSTRVKFERSFTAGQRYGIVVLTPPDDGDYVISLGVPYGDTVWSKDLKRVPGEPMFLNAVDVNLETTRYEVYVAPFAGNPKPSTGNLVCVLVGHVP